MKHLLILTLLMLIIVGCQNENSKIETALKSYFNENAKDPSSYEPVETKVDTITYGYIAKFLIESESSYSGETAVDIIVGSPADDNEELSDSLLEISNTKVKILSKFTNNEKPFGYVVKHKYRAKNGFGALDLSTDYFVLDTLYSVKSNNDSYSSAVQKLLRQFESKYLND